jgi:predicted O-linked N-acetylglucosamine transferase (SPINDLY family)
MEGTPSSRRIRIAYLSFNLVEHPVAFQLVELLERHDRGRFEVFGIATAHDDGSDIRKRIVKACDQFLDASGATDRAVAEYLARNEVDILVELNGHTDGACFGILARRPCPIQVSWLGYAGTTGSAFVDYLIADRFVVPEDHERFFSEKLVRLVDTFFVSDTTRRSAKAARRAELGLPETGFVFCCFNASWKITRPVFRIWMRLLANIPTSLLWLKDCPPKVKENLLREAQSFGIARARIIFAPGVEREAHLARLAAADLFLDTLPYNAHASACDALWAGLPVLTCNGTSFAGRVGSSLLQAVGLPELIAPDLQEYEARALDLAGDAAQLVDLRRRLAIAIRESPLFDTDRFRKNIESAFEMMVLEQRTSPLQAARS